MLKVNTSATIGTHTEERKRAYGIFVRLTDCIYWNSSTISSMLTVAQQRATHHLTSSYHTMWNVQHWWSSEFCLFAVVIECDQWCATFIEISWNFYSLNFKNLPKILDETVLVIDQWIIKKTEWKATLAVVNLYFI